MAVAYAVPLERAWQRMVLLLFKPFRLAVWLVLGFAAFIGANWRGGFGFGGSSWRRGWDDPNPVLWVRNALDEPFWVGFFLAAGLVLLAIGLVLAWVFARGAFVFLDDVLRARIAIVEPWQRFARQGNSLFLWRLALGLLGLLLAGLLLLFWLPVIRVAWQGGEPGWPEIWPGLTATFAAVPVFLLFAVVQVLLDHFVVPVMWAHGLTTNDAWRRFLPVLRAHPGPFVVYVLILIGLGIATVAAVLAFGAVTCCCGFCLLAIPYVGSVITLPITVFLRALGPEFLSQFGDALPTLPPPMPAQDLPPPAYAVPPPPPPEPPPLP
jgi:hypothetical protein